MTHINEIALINATFENGDKCAGYCYEENGIIWYHAIDKNTGMIYETQEIPAIRLDLTITQFTGNWSEKQVNDYFYSIGK